MGTPENIKISEIVDRVRSWIPRRMEPANVSRDFWMPDQSCRVCYECDSQFTIFNRRHHCRLCGRVFCAKCTANSIPAPSDEPKNSREDWERIRVCNFCFKQWEQGMATVDTGMTASSPGISPSPSATSLVSKSSSNSGSSVGSTAYSTGPYQHVAYSLGHSPCHSAQMDPAIVKKDQGTSPRKSSSIYIRDPFPDQYGPCNRSDDEDDDYDVYRSHCEPSHFSPADAYYNALDEINHVYGPENNEPNYTNATLFPENVEMQSSEGASNLLEESDRQKNGVESEASPSSDIETTDTETVDFENNDLLWLPPEPKDEEDEREALLPDDDDDGVDDTSGEWGYLRSSSSSTGGEYRNRDRSIEEHRKAMKNVLDGHFRALIAQLLQIENLPVSEEDSKESWLEIITALSWDAATLLKPDTSKTGGMDPGGYVKVKCLACGRRSESTVVKGVVCKKNVAHRRMTSKFDKPRLLILGGALEYQRVANHLSSFDTLLQQEMDHLKMAVAKIDAHHPNILLVEKSVSRHAQEYLLAKNISLVLNVKKPLLERVARCTGAQIIPSIDHLTTPKLGYCDTFHVEKFLEEHGSAGQGGKKLIKTLMFFEGCPKPFGCTILLKGASGDELKKVKHVLQYGVFAAYHLALETSFLADEGASLPELPLKSPIKVALPDKAPSIDRSISTIPGFTVPAAEKPQGLQTFNEPSRSNSSLLSDMASPSNRVPIPEAGSNRSGSRLDGKTDPSRVGVSNVVSTFYPSRNDILDLHQRDLSGCHASAEKIKIAPNESAPHIGEVVGDNNLTIKCPSNLETSEQCVSYSNPDGKFLSPNSSTSVLTVLGHENNNNHEEVGSKEEFPPSPSDHQSILVSLTTRCVLKGTVCERAHLFRIKYYGSFDKPLGRFLRDHLFDQSYHCRSCDMPSEAHIHCYTHQQGSLTISVKKLEGTPLSGEREGKIWMWHRCLRCPRTRGFPPSTRRVLMSDAAWGLSFGKFLELSFSNHAAASRVASCGHSLHRDCLRFYGFGRMVACFRYAPIVVNSVYLPPSKLEFNYGIQDWIQKEADEVCTSADHLFDEVFKALHQVVKKFSVDNGTKASELGLLISVLEGMLVKEKEEFEESLWQVLHGEVKVGQPAVDILEINRLKRQLIYHSYIWDQRLIHVRSLSNTNIRGISSLSPKVLEKPACSSEKPIEMNATARPGKGFGSCDFFLLNVKPDITFIHGMHAQISSPDGAHKGTDMNHNLIDGKDADVSPLSGPSVNEQCSPQSGTSVRHVHSEGQFPEMDNLSDTLDAAWTGESQSRIKDNGSACPDSLLKDTFTVNGTSTNVGIEHGSSDRDEAEVPHASTLALPTKVLDNVENSMAWVWMPFPSLYVSLNKGSSNHAQKFCKLSEYNPVYISSFRELVHQGGGRLLLLVGINDTVVSVYDDEPTSIISYALASTDHHFIMSDEHGKPRDALESSSSLPILDSFNLLSVRSLDETASESLRSLASVDESILPTPGSRGSSGLDPHLYANGLHPRVSFQDDGPLGKAKYTVTCYYAKKFEALRRISCPSELDFVRSLSRCKKWGAQGGKSNVFFAKTLDDRFIIKQVTKTELESFIKFAPDYFQYLSHAISTGSPTCLAKILGIYQVTSKQQKGGKETKMDVLVMENLLYRRNITRLYDLKGSSRSRYNPDSSGSNKVLLDQNLIETMPTSPIFVGTKAKRLLERAVWNDTSFLASIDVMDYSLLVGIDEEKHELVLGIIDFMRQYTWDKHLESWVKASGILGGPKNVSPTVISPDQYKRRFRKAMSAYFLMVPDQWPSLTITPPRSQSDLREEHSQGNASL